LWPWMGKGSQLRPDTKFNLILLLIPLAGLLVIAGVWLLVGVCQGR